MWGHYHPSDKERDETECRLFEITKNISNYGVGRLVYNKYETSYDSENYNLLNDSKDPETFWVSFLLRVRKIIFFKILTRAWYDWNTPETDPVTQQQHTGNFGYAYGICFHKGETDGLEREMNMPNYSVNLSLCSFALINTDLGLVFGPA